MWVWVDQSLDQLDHQNPGKEWGSDGWWVVDTLLVLDTVWVWVAA